MSEITCEICKKPFKNMRSLAFHVLRKHNITSESYYNNYIHTTSGICICGKHTRFLDITAGYAKYCSSKCAKNDSAGKIRQKLTCLKKYGADNPAKNKAVQFKMVATFKKHYKDKTGISHPFCNPEVRQRIKEEYLSKHGVEYPMQLPEIRKKVIGHLLPSANEAKIEEFLKNRRFNFKKNFDINGKNFDFAVFDENNRLKLLIETDGELWHGLVHDPDGIQSKGTTDNERFYKTPDGVKFLCADGLKTDALLSEIVSTFNMDYKAWIETIINSLPKDFPFPKYSAKRMNNDIELLKKAEYNPKQYLGMSLIRNFHESIWKCNVGKYMSPYDAWNNNSMLRKCVENRFIYASVLSSQNIADGFNKCKIAPKISVFNPSFAKYILQKYSPDSKIIIDPFSGFSGRMLGAYATNKSYCGYDINPVTIKESNDLREYIGYGEGSLKVEDIQSIKEIRAFPDSCLFTCPPYNDKENWGMDIPNKSCDEWIDICIKKYKCDEYIFVVDNTEKYKDNIVETVSTASYYTKYNELIIKIK